VDAKSVMVYRLCKRGTCFPVVDLVHAENCRSLGSLSSQAPSDDEMENPYYASGQVYSSSSLDTMLVQSFYNPTVVTLIEQLLAGCIYAMAARDVFTKFEGVTCLDLQRALLEVDVVLLGLYRKSPNRLRFVMSNPPPEAAVQSDDMLIVLECASKHAHPAKTVEEPVPASTPTAGSPKTKKHKKKTSTTADTDGEVAAPKEEQKQELLKEHD